MQHRLRVSRSLASADALDCFPECLLLFFAQLNVNGFGVLLKVLDTLGTRDGDEVVTFTALAKTITPIRLAIITHPCANTQAIHSCPTVHPFFFAISSKVSTNFKLLAKFSSENLG